MSGGLGLGLDTGFGAGASADELHRIVAERLLKMRMAEAMRAAQVNEAQRQQQLDQHATYQNAQLESMSEERAAQTQLRHQTAGENLAKGLSIGDVLQPNQTGVLKTANMNNAIEHQMPSLASTAYSGVSTLPAPGRPMQGLNEVTPHAAHGEQDVFTGLGPQRQAQQQRQDLDRLITSLPPGSRERLALEYKKNTGENAPAGAFEPKPSTGLHQVGPQGIYMTDEDARGKPAYHPPQQQQTITIQTVDENGRPVTKIVPKTAGSVFKKAPGQTVEGRLASAQAVNQTGNDIIAKLNDPAFKAAVGPALGRASTLRDFIGNPPPQFSELAGAIESYALANMGVHGMRSAQGAEQIKHLLDQHHTPESLVATIQGLNRFSEHFLENEGRGTGSNPDPLGLRK
jgi:hypothetical protein